MKKFFDSFKFILKAFLLVIILLIGWAFINVANLIKGKKSSKESFSSKNIFGANDAKADVPSSCVSTDCFWQNCPFVAYFDGKKFQIENDFLCGSPNYFITDNLKAPEFNRAPVRTDMLKFLHPLGRQNGKIILELQENELEESFVDWVKLIRVVHPKESEVFVNSNFENFSVFNKKELDDKIFLPEKVILNGQSDIRSAFSAKEELFESKEKSAVLNKNDAIEFLFCNLAKNAPPILIVKSAFRDFMMGEAEARQPKIGRRFAFSLFSPILKRAPLFLAVLAYFIFERKSMSGLSAFLLPFVAGSGSMCKSIIFSYQDASGNFCRAAINKPRAGNFGTEIIKLPQEAVREDGTLRVKADFTKRHKLGFIGIFQNMAENKWKKEELAIERAESSRLGDVKNYISGKRENYTHMIPGDKITVEFSEPKLSISENEKETYLFQSFGFYTPLRGKYKKIAGDWTKKISKEARSRFQELIELKKYS